jgi:hypothetical protein
VLCPNSWLTWVGYVPRHDDPEENDNMIYSPRVDVESERQSARTGTFRSQGIERLLQIPQMRRGALKELFSAVLPTWMSSFSSRDYDHKSHFESIARQRYPDTCEWILESEPVRWWCARNSPSVLWISGSPGVGKSTFLSYLVDNLLSKRSHHEVGRNSAVIFSFCMNLRNHTASQILSVAICQMLQQFPKLKKEAFEYDRNLFGGEETLRPRQGKTRPYQVLWRLFRKIVEEAKLDKLFLVIDGLDECEPQSQSQLIQLFQGVAAESLCIKILFSSRPDPEIKKTFSHCSARAPGLFKHAAVEDLEDPINGDIDRYIVGEIERIGDLKHLSVGERELIKEKLTRERAAVFLPVALLFREIEDDKHRTVAEILEDIPKDLQNVYQKLLGQITVDNHRGLQFVLKYLVYSIVELTPRDIAYACHVLEPRRMNDKNPMGNLIEDHLAQTRRHLESLSTILRVRGDREPVLFIHATSKLYLIQRALTDPPGGLLTTPWNAHRDIAISCLNLIVDKSRNIELPVFWTDAHTLHKRFRSIMEYPFLEYAFRNWYAHLKEAMDQIPENKEIDTVLLVLIQRLIQLWNNPPPGFRYTLLHYGGLEGLDDRLEKKVSIIEIFSVIGLTRCLKMLFQNYPEKYRTVTERVHRAVLFTIRGGHESSFDVLVKHFGITSLDGDEYIDIITNSAWSCHFSLLAKTMRLRKPRLPELVEATSVAFTTGERKTLNELTKDRTIFQLPDEQGRTALHLLFITSIQFAREEPTSLEAIHKEQGIGLMLAQALFYQENGVEINAKDRFGFTALHYVCWAPALCKTELVEGLIKNGADPMLETKGGLTPFHLAVHYSRTPDVIQLLLNTTKNRLAQVSTKGMMTPLHWAVQRHFIRADKEGYDTYTCTQQGPASLILKLLILGGGDPYVQNKRGLSAIDYARHESVPLLESLYANPNDAQDSQLIPYYESPSHQHTDMQSQPLALIYPPYEAHEDAASDTTPLDEQDIDLTGGLVCDDDSESFVTAAETIQTESSGRSRRRRLFRWYRSV